MGGQCKNWRNSVEILSDSDEEGNVDYLPALEEFVALVAANQTAKFPELFVGRVIRLTEDRKTAYLAVFSEEAPGKFKLSRGKSFRENVSALVYPIDIISLHSNREYELRTPKIYIHREVHKK